MPIDRKLMASSSDMLVLKLLESEDMYGYQMIEQLRERSKNVFDMKAGTLYPLLHQLEQKEYLTTYEQSAGEARIRKYYHLTEKGRKYLIQREKDWKLFANAIGDVLGGVSCALV